MGMNESKNPYIGNAAYCATMNAGNWRIKKYHLGKVMQRSELMAV